jgi:hypothetical protein
MAEQSQIDQLQQLITDEIFKAMGWVEHGMGRKLFNPLFTVATRHFSELFAGLEEQLDQHGLPQAASWLLPNFVQGCKIGGSENIPQKGPLVIACNHPGAVDSVLVAANAGRQDLKIIGGDIPFLVHLPNVSRHMIYTSYTDMHVRMAVVRQSIRHLQENGSLLLFARTTTEPDPAVMPGALAELEHWSRSLEVILERVPDTRVVVAIVSGVLRPESLRHPFTWLRRKTRVDYQRLAMFIQIIQQMVLGQNFALVPKLTFGPVLDAKTLRHDGRPLLNIIACAKQLMQEHLVGQV